MIMGTSRRVPKAATFVKDPSVLDMLAPNPAPNILPNKQLNVKSR